MVSKEVASAQDVLGHEIKSVVDSAKRHLDEVGKEASDLMSGGIPNQVRIWRDRLSLASRGSPLVALSSAQAEDLDELFGRIQRTSVAMRTRIRRNHDVEATFKYLLHKLEHVDAMESLRGLGLTNLELEQSLNLAKSLDELLASYRASVGHGGRYLTVRLGNAATCTLNTYPLLWNLIGENLLKNMQKYALDNSPCSVEFHGQKLSIKNEGRLALDETKDALISLGVRGRLTADQSPGRGLGLGVVKLACAYAKIGFEVRVTHLGKRHGVDDVAEFDVTLDLSAVLTK